MLANQLVQFDKELLKFFVGFDTHSEAIRKATENLKNQKSYPPYNIKTVGDNSFIIEIAVLVLVVMILTLNFITEH